MTKQKSAHLIPAAINPLHRIRVMGRLVRRAVKKPGTAPGTLVHSGEKKVERTVIRFLDYDADNFHEAEVPDIAACVPFKESPTVSWINVDGLHDVELVRRIGEEFEWHPLMLEDIVSVGQRPKLEEYANALYIVLPMLRRPAKPTKSSSASFSASGTSSRSRSVGATSSRVCASGCARSADGSARAAWIIWRTLSSTPSWTTTSRCWKGSE